MGAVAAGHEADDVALGEPARPLGRPHGRRPGDDDQPLLAGVVPVVRMAPLAGGDLDDPGADLVRPDRLTDSCAPRAVPVALTRVVERRCEEVQPAHPGSVLAR